MFRPTIFEAFSPLRAPPNRPPPPPPGNPMSLVLLALKNPITRILSLNTAPMARAEYLSSVPTPASILENVPLFIPFLIPKSSTVCSSPSSIPDTLARSLFSSYAFTLSITDVGRFFIAVLVSPVINSLPSTSIFFTSLPLMVILPSSLTWAPGSLFTSSSTTDPSGVRYAAALYTKVSSFSVTFAALAVTVAPSSMMASVFIDTFPRATFFPLTVMSFE